MKLRTEIEWWVPGGSIVYCGTPKTRAEWIRLTWRGYLAYWELSFWAGLALFSDYRERAGQIFKEEGEGHGGN